MVAMNQIKRFGEQIGKEFKAEKVILFGSYAQGTAKEDSDVDLLVVTHFQGRSVDDLFWPMHMNFRFFNMEPLETFTCFDVLKNPDIENDFKRFADHLHAQFPEATA